MLIYDLGVNLKDAANIFENYEYTNEKIFKLSEELNSVFPKDFKENVCIFLVGSYGRLEASNNSDLDCIFIYKNRITNIDKVKIIKLVFQSAKKIGINKTPGDTGTFTEFIKVETLLKNIGGINDNNKNLTRRILILTESYFLYNENLCNEVKSKIFNEYTKGKRIGKEPRELINELVRYYRTITIDYKYKVEEQNKSWAIRNLKLRHSRKFLYFTSIAIIFTAMKQFRNNEDKYEYILTHINHPPLIKLGKVLIENKKHSYHELFKLYNRFLKYLNDDEIRKELECLPYEKRYDSHIFFESKKNSDKFEDSLKDLIKTLDGWDTLIYKYTVL